jgi:hypothetical protein
MTDNIILSGSNPHDLFWSYNTLIGHPIDTEQQEKLNQFIFYKENQTGDFSWITYTIKRSNKASDDKIYCKHPEMVKLLPRAMTLIFDLNGNFLTCLSGPCKFSGIEHLDDDDTNIDKGKPPSVYNPLLTKTWVEKKQCQIVKLTKANGKFAIMKLFTHNERSVIAFGSKNYHLVYYSEDLEKTLVSEAHTEITASIGKDILNNLELFFHLMPHFSRGYSLVGELEDGMHFVPGNNTVSWFGLFKEGFSAPPISTLETLSGIGLQTVKHELVFKPGDQQEKLDQIFSLLKCEQGEGSVLYISNTETNAIQLAKSKSTVYIFKRMFREIWTKTPTQLHEKLIKRVIDTQDYHRLNTKSAINLTRCLFDFSLWLSHKNFPTGVLDYTPLQSVRGELPAGFSAYWQQFIAETGVEDIKLEPNHFGTFNAHLFQEAPNLKTFLAFNPLTKPLVIFLQDLQGGGKSAIANMLPDFQVVEQDLCYGCTKAAQFQLLEYISAGKNVVVSRCNVSAKQYRSYLKIAKSRNCRILFIASSDVKSELRLAIALAGVLERSEVGDSVIVGRYEYPFDRVVQFTSENWRAFQYHRKAIKLKTFTHDNALAIQAKDALDKKTTASFVMNKKADLMALRRPLHDIVAEIEKIVAHPPSEHWVNKSLQDTLYIGLHVIDKEILIDIVKKHCSMEGKRLYCEHLTQIYLGKKEIASVEVIAPGEKCLVTLDALVINTDNGSAAFRATNIVATNGQKVEIATEKPHITALVAFGYKPSDSVSYVMKNDDSVSIFPLDLVVETECVWN